MAAAQRFLDDALAAALQRLRRLEERADLDAVLDAAEAGEQQRGEQGVAALRFGHEEAHGLGGVHMLGDLRHGHDQPHRARLLVHQAAEVHRLRSRRGERLVHGGEQGAAPGGAGGRAGQVGEAQPRGVVDLRRVQARVGVGEREAVRGEAGAGDAEAEPRAVVRRRGERRGHQVEQRLGGGHRSIAHPDEGAGRSVCTAAGSGSPGPGQAAIWARTASSAAAARSCSGPAQEAGSAAIWAAKRASCSSFIRRRSRSVSCQPMSVRPSVS